MSSTIKQNIGSVGEGLACAYLANKGYKIVERNYRTKFGEIDIIAKSPDKTLIICEVKTMKYDKKETNKCDGSYTQESDSGVNNLNKHNGRAVVYNQDKDLLKPEDQMSYSKIKKFKRIAEWYSNKNLDRLRCSEYRLDYISVYLYNNYADIKYYKNIIQ